MNDWWIYRKQFWTQKISVGDGSAWVAGCERWGLTAAERISIMWKLPIYIYIYKQYMYVYIYIYIHITTTTTATTTTATTTTVVPTCLCVVYYTHLDLDGGSSDPKEWSSFAKKIGNPTFWLASGYPHPDQDIFRQNCCHNIFQHILWYIFWRLLWRIFWHRCHSGAYINPVGSCLAWHRQRVRWDRKSPRTCHIQTRSGGPGWHRESASKSGMTQSPRASYLTRSRMTQGVCELVTRGAKKEGEERRRGGADIRIYRRSPEQCGNYVLGFCSTW